MADDDLTPFTPAGAERLRAAAAELAAAVTAHAEAVAAVSGEDGMPEVFAASDRLLPAVLRYADAQFDLTGNDFPFGVLHTYADDEEADLDDATDATDPLAGAPAVAVDGSTGTAEIAVLQRHDLLVTDEVAVLAAARRAGSAATPDGEETAAEGTDLGRALSQLAAAGGWDALGDVPGLRSTARSVLVVGRELDAEADDDRHPEDDEDGEEEGGELLYSRQDVFPG